MDGVSYCCEACRQKSGASRSYMIVCPVCHNKRCPKAENHEYRCTGSNAVGQVGVPEGAGEFTECDTCRAKPGSPLLCSGCLANRATIASLQSEVANLRNEVDDTRKLLAQYGRTGLERLHRAIEHIQPTLASPAEDLCDE